TRSKRDWSSDVCSSDLTLWSSGALIGASPRPARRSADQRSGAPKSLLSVFALVLRLPLLVDVLDAGDVLDRAPRGARRAPHRVVQGLADLVLGGAGLLRGREASRHSGGAPGGAHRGQRHELHRLRIERAF